MPVVNKVVYGGNTIIDITDTTAVATDVVQGKVFYTQAGVRTVGTASPGSGSAISVVDSQDSHGGTIRTITAVDLSADTVTAATLLNGYTAHDANGNAITGTASGGGPISLQSKTVNVTPSETAYSSTTSADSGYDGLSSVEVNVSAISSSYVGTGITRRSSSDLTASGATVTAPAGYYSSQATKSVATGTAGTPSASKGTVSNHSISVTPSVTNTTGYITGGTKTGTAVTVSASELVSGTLSIAQNGTSDVTNYANVSVAIPIVTYYTGSSTPSSSLGSNGDIYLKTS